MSVLETIPPRSSDWTVLPGGVDAFLCRGSALRPLAVITAGVHGDEYEGPAAVAEICGRLRADAMEGSVIAVPVANPMAFSAAQRTSPDDGLNLARTFPGNPSGSATERLAAALYEELARGADYLIDLHSGGVEYLFSPLAGFYGDPVEQNPSYRAARHFGLQVLWQLPETKGVLSCEAWKSGVTTLGAEYLGAGQLADSGVSGYLRGVLSCLALWGICPEERILPPGGETFAGDWQLASEAGIFQSRCRLGERVAPGQVLAATRDTRGRVVEEFRATTAGTVIALRSKAYIRKGDWGVLIATNV